MKQVRHQRKAPQRWGDYFTYDLFSINGRTEYGNCRRIPLVVHAGQSFLKSATTSLDAFCDDKGLLPEKQCGFRAHRLTTDMTLCKLQELRRETHASIDSTVCHRSAECLRLYRPHNSLACTRSHRRATVKYSSYPPIQRCGGSLRTE